MFRLIITQIPINVIVQVKRYISYIQMTRFHKYVNELYAMKIAILTETFLRQFWEEES